MKPALRILPRHPASAGALLLALAASPLVRAEDAAPAPPEAGAEVVQRADEVVYQKTTVLDFSDVTLEGELTRPEGSYLLNRQKARFGSLVQLRADFKPELQKSADNL